jgi:2'-5' RNA ligase
MKMYFIAIVLPASLNEKILPLKNMMKEKYGCHAALRSPSHITLVPPFWMDELEEPALNEDINNLSNELSTFTIKTNNFSCFRPRTIFIATEANNELNAIKKEADNYFTNKPSYKIKIDTRPFHPHITIANRDLFKKNFYESWEYFKNKKFKEECVVTGMSLLKHNQKNWDVIFTSQFQ